MKNSYFDLIQQSYDFPAEPFHLDRGLLHFHSVSLKELIAKYGTPFRLLYLPLIGEKISKVKKAFKEAFEHINYQGKYYYAYCSKCNHYAPVLEKVLEAGAHLETSSVFDTHILLELNRQGKIKKDTFLLHNGYKDEAYLIGIRSLIKEGFTNCTIILDSKNELIRIRKLFKDHVGKLKLGLRMATDEESKSAYHTSRLGIRYDEVIPFVESELMNDPLFELKMLHFFVDSGMEDKPFYWGELSRVMDLYIKIKRIHKSLTSINLGGGFPIRKRLNDDFEAGLLISKIVSKIKTSSREANIIEPDIFTEFGKYTIGESGATIFSVVEQKQQNDSEKWYIIDTSLLNTVPDAWALFEKFILLPVNHWDKEYERVNIGGISCDRTDYYNSEDFNQQILLPKIDSEKEEALYLGFFHTAAYQDAVSGYGGVKHCLVPEPKSIIIDKDANGNITDQLFRQSGSVEEMLHILGYRK